MCSHDSPCLLSAVSQEFEDERGKKEDRIPVNAGIRP